MKIENEIISSVIAAVKEPCRRLRVISKVTLPSSYSHSSKCRRKSLRIQHRKSANT